ncbi:hypothetical protein NQ318_019222 [Aromia moschata]|uniref:Uncharacterized protein n=1 Tax=Aromia moschata TaxID=1265417 RepID=A0AAV8YWN4_9CUCU|nr:hypothetical protein NQ318_019222 [Aromia moschata]
MTKVGSSRISRLETQNLKHLTKMATNSPLERIKKNAEAAQHTIDVLKNELNVINREYNNILAKQLKEENMRLLVAVEEAKRDLIQLRN